MSDQGSGVQEFLEATEGIEDSVEQLEDELDEMSENGEITLDTGNFEELVVLMLQDIKIDLMKIQKYLAEKDDDFDIEDL